MNEVGIDTNDRSVTIQGRNGEKKKVYVTKILANEKQMGGCFDKRKVEAVVNPDADNIEGKRVIRLVLKDAYTSYWNHFPSEVLGLSVAERYLEKWNILRNCGIPTVSSMRVIDRDTVAMGDMTWDGSAFFGKQLVSDIGDKKDLDKRSLTVMEKIFLGIDPNKIKEEMKRVQMLAWDKGIRLPDDDLYDLIVHPDGTWQVLVVDLANLRPRKNERLESIENELNYMWEDVDIIRKHLLEISSDK
jgi:hypothetical protein